MATLRDSKAISSQDVGAIVSALVSGKLVDEYDMNWAKRVADRQAKPLVDVLVDLELVTPLDVQTCLDSLKRLGRIKD